MLLSVEYRRLARTTRNLAEQEREPGKKAKLHELANEYEARAKSKEVAEMLEKLEGDQTKH